jgi:glycosyltransferase involved in cell wall biosynthesis
VHVSEWRGSGYLSLLAKRQRLAFQDTLFIVKTSSPWMWNRLYGSHPLDHVDDLAKVQAERRSVEFADIVIGGSLHLLRWMSSQGYRIPRDRTFVQPNVATFDHTADLMTQRDWERGKRHPVDELVFFGRLEARKGLFTFVQAIKRLLRQGAALPRQITFMGKPGARLMARPDQDIVDYIETETATWPTKIEILSEFQQYEALSYLLSGNRLAVMPSMIENSSLAVYEAAICGIPFIASNSGGTPELIATIDHPHVLCEAHPVPLADKISEALSLGGYVARPSFDNTANLEQWRRFHVDLGRGLMEQLLPAARQAPELTATASICIYHAGSDEKLRATLASILEQDNQPEEVLIAVDNDDVAALDGAQAVAATVGLTARIVPTFDLDAGQSFNVLADLARGDFLLFLWAGSTIRPMALRALTKVAASSNADLVNYFFRVTHEEDDSVKDYLSAIVFGNVAQSFFRTDVTSLPLLVKRQTFSELGGFTTDYRVLAYDHELVAKAQISGVHCETALLELGTVPAWDEEWLRAKCYDQSVAQFRAIRPQLAGAPLALRELLLMSKGLQKSGVRRRGPGKARVQKVEAEGTLGRLLTAFSTDLLSNQSPQVAPQARTPPPRPVKADPKRIQRGDNAVAAPGNAAAMIEPKAVAAALRKDRVAARQAAARGAGLVQLIDELSAETVDVEPAPPTPKRVSVTYPRAAMEPASAIAPTLFSSEGKKYVGGLLGVYRGIAYGQVRNDARPDEIVEVEVIPDGGRARTIRADLDLPMVLPSPARFRGRGFAVPLWSRWAVLRQRATTLLRVKGTAIEIANLSIRRNVNQLEKAGFDGYCDLVDGHVRGWVWQPSDPHHSVDVSIFVDGKFLARTTASSARQDLRAAGIGSGSYGFSVSLPKQLRDGTPRNVDVVVADTGIFLKRGQLRLVGDELQVAQ